MDTIPSIGTMTQPCSGSNSFCATSFASDLHLTVMMRRQTLILTMEDENRITQTAAKYGQYQLGKVREKVIRKDDYWNSSMIIHAIDTKLMLLRR